jgi:hypothetical protein
MARSQRLDITYQTLYSELVLRGLDESFTSEFSSSGRFVAVEVKGKNTGTSMYPSPKAEARIAAMSVPWRIPKSPRGSRRSRFLTEDEVCRAIRHRNVAPDKGEMTEVRTPNRLAR